MAKYSKSQLRAIARHFNVFVRQDDDGNVVCNTNPKAENGWRPIFADACREAFETPVIFRMGRGNGYAGDGAVAVFPCEPHDVQGNSMSCYVQVGQHGACDLGWYKMHTRAAKPDEYALLKAELEAAPYGYRLKVYKRMQPWMREALATEARRLRQRGNV